MVPLGLIQGAMSETDSLMSLAQALRKLSLGPKKKTTQTVKK